MVFCFQTRGSAKSLYLAGDIGLSFVDPHYIHEKTTAFNYGTFIGLEFTEINLAVEAFMQLVVSGYTDTLYRNGFGKHDFGDNIYGAGLRYYLSVFDVGAGVAQHRLRQTIKDSSFQKLWERKEDETNWYWLVGFRMPFSSPRVDMFFDYMHFNTRRASDDIDILLVGVRLHAGL